MPYLILTHPFLLPGYERATRRRRRRGWPRRRRWRGAKELRVGVRGAGAGEDAALAEVRGMVGAVPDRRRESSGQGGAARCAAARRPRAGWLAARPAVVGGGGGGARRR
jgi:hypothetical protein